MGKTSGWQTNAKAKMGTVYAVCGRITKIVNALKMLKLHKPTAGCAMGLDARQTQERLSLTECCN